jgi:SulP family sulfate permease
MNNSKAIPRLIPAHLSGDLWGGFAAMLVALPSAIAFGVTIFSPLGSGFGAQGALAGMLGVTVLGLVAATFGGTQRLISAPCAPAAAILTAVTIELSRQAIEPGAIVISLFLIAITCGLIQIVFGLLQVGKLIRFMPYTVVSGYLSGVGLIIVISQLPKWLSLPKGIKLIDGIWQPHLWQFSSIAIGIASALAMILAPKFSKRIPAVIQGLLAGVFVYWLLAWSAFPELRSLENNSFIIGPLAADPAALFENLQQSLEQLFHPNLPPLEQIMIPALTLAILLSIDTLKTCVVLDALTGSRHNSNRELVGQGLGNVSASLLGGTPGAGTMGATLVNKASGGTTRLSGVLQGLWSLIAILVLTPLIAWVPIASLAALLVVIGIKMIDWKSIAFARSKETFVDFVVILSVVVVANTVGLIAASGLGVGLAILLFIREQIHSATVRKKSYGNQLFSKHFRTNAERQILQQDGQQTVIYELQGSLFFGTTDQLYLAIEPEIDRARYVLLDFFRVQSIDITAAHMIERIRNRLAEKQTILVLSRLPERLPSGRDLRSYIDHLGLTNDGSTQIVNEMSDGLEWIENRILEKAKIISAESKALALNEFEIFKAMDEKTLSALTSCMTQQHIPANTCIFQANSPGEELMLISSGKIKITLSISKNTIVHLATLGRGQFFGEMSFLDRQGHSADVYAQTDVELLIMTRTDFDRISASNPTITAQVMQSIAIAIATRLRHTNSDLLQIRE